LHACGHNALSFGVLQSAPMKPGSQKHFPTWHIPCPEHVSAASDDGQISEPRVTVAQSSPPKPGSHTHMPLMHRPRSLHGGSPGHGSVFSQNSPENPGSQKQRPLKQTPCELQFCVHDFFTEQALPEYPV
jgi:hypothetical protein